MGRGRELKARVFISIGGAEPVPWESLTPEKQAECSKKITENFMRAVNEYYTLHPDEFKALCEANPDGVLKPGKAYRSQPGADSEIASR